METLLFILIFILLIVIALIFIIYKIKIPKGGIELIVGGAVKTIKHIDLFDDYVIGKDHPIKLYENNIHIIGHIAGMNASGKTTLGEKIQKEHPEIIVKDLDEFLDGVPYSKKRIYILRDKMREFIFSIIKSKNNKPILFVGYNYEGGIFIYIPGDKCFID